MNILSFDVGIKNLSYCTLDENKDIKNWGILNLNESPKCSMCLKKPCEKQASYITEINGKKCYYCTTHIKHKSLGKIKKKKINTNHDMMNLSQICIKNLKTLNLENISSVLIENQPALKNPVMKSIQMIIYTFFIIEGVMKESSSIKSVHMVNARNKLKVYKGEPVSIPFKNDKKNKYKINKFLSVEYTKNMIQNQTDEIKYIFNSSKKKDDLADSYLQGIYWIEK